jgi:hypothetical protein
MEVGGQRHATAALTPGETIMYEAGWAPGPVWTGAENLIHTGIRSPDRPSRSEQLYRLSYRGPITVMQLHFLFQKRGKNNHVILYSTATS